MDGKNELTLTALTTPANAPIAAFGPGTGIPSSPFSTDSRTSWADARTVPLCAFHHSRTCWRICVRRFSRALRDEGGDHTVGLSCRSFVDTPMAAFEASWSLIKMLSLATVAT
jgi:hypothetical protein